MACEAIKEEEARGTKLFTICATTAADCRETIVLGPSGIMSCYSEKDPRRPTYFPSKSRLEWPSGAVARLLSAENPNSSRGINSSFIYMDEIASYADIDVFHQLMFGLRIAPAKAIITTTPKATPTLIELSKRIGKDVRLISGSTFENQSNLSGNFISSIKAAYEGTSLGEQELYGKLILTSPDALWQQQTILDNTVEEEDVPEFISIAIGIDPAVSSGKNSDLTGIVVVGLGNDDKMYTLGDHSGKYSPQAWTSKVVSLYDQYSQNAPVTLVVERNQGGDLIADSLSRERSFLPIKTIFSTANKLSRAQPIALLYEQSKVKHVRGRGLGDLENELISYDGKGKGKSNTSPNRMDALVFACTHLMPAKRSFVKSREILF